MNIYVNVPSNEETVHLSSERTVSDIASDIITTITEFLADGEELNIAVNSCNDALITAMQETAAERNQTAKQNSLDELKTDVTDPETDINEFISFPHGQDELVDEFVTSDMTVQEFEAALESLYTRTPDGVQETTVYGKPTTQTVARAHDTTRYNGTDPADLTGEFDLLVRINNDFRDSTSVSLQDTVGSDCHVLDTTVENAFTQQPTNETGHNTETESGAA